MSTFSKAFPFLKFPEKNLKNWPNIKSWKVDSGMSKGKEMLYFSPATPLETGSEESIKKKSIRKSTFITGYYSSVRYI